MLTSVFLTTPRKWKFDRFCIRFWNSIHTTHFFDSFWLRIYPRFTVTTLVIHTPYQNIRIVTFNRKITITPHPIQMWKQRIPQIIFTLRWIKLIRRYKKIWVLIFKPFIEWRIYDFYLKFCKINHFYFFT